VLAACAQSDLTDDPLSRVTTPDCGVIERDQRASIATWAGNSDLGREMSTEEIERYSRAAADAVAAALRLARSELPEASDARLLLLIVGHVAACLGQLRVRSQESPGGVGISQPRSKKPQATVNTSHQDLLSMNRIRRGWSANLGSGAINRYIVQRLPHARGRAASEGELIQTAEQR
jgi:hypothetical protein